jgi:hypothetical protein
LTPVDTVIADRSVRRHAEIDADEGVLGNGLPPCQADDTDCEVSGPPGGPLAPFGAAAATYLGRVEG